MPAITQKTDMSAPDPADEAFSEGLDAGPAGGWQEIAGIFSAIAEMLSLTAQDANHQGRKNLVRHLDQLEATVHNGAGENEGRLKAELAKLEAELQAWRGAAGGPGFDAAGAAEPGVMSGKGGSFEQSGHLSQEVQDLFSLSFAGPECRLAKRRGVPDEFPDRFPAGGIDRAVFVALGQRIEASHLKLAARLEAGLSSAANETKTLKDLIAGKKFEQACDADQSRRPCLSLEGEVAKLAGRLDHAGEGFASLEELERAISGLSVQLDETRKIASGLSGAATAGTAAYGDKTQAVLEEITNLGAIHENAWQRVQATLTDIQHSLDHLTKAVRDGQGFANSMLVSASTDPFAPILTSLSQHGQDGSLAARVIRAGAGEKAMQEKMILKGGGAFASALPQAAPASFASEAASAASHGDGDAGHFLIEPGLGFPSRGGDGEASGQSNGAPKNSYDREDTSGRTDFIAAARRAARAAQLESAAATSNIAPSRIENGGARVPGAVPVRGGLLLSNRQLVFWSVLVLAALGGGVATLVHPRFHDFVPELLKKFERGAGWDASKATAGTMPTPQTIPQDAPASPPPSSRPRASVSKAEATVVVELDPLAPHPLVLVENAVPAQENGHSGDHTAPSISAPSFPIAGSDAIVADRLAQSNGAYISARSRPAAIFPLGTVLQAAPLAPARSLPARAAARDLAEDAKSGDAAAQLELATRFAEGSTSERNYEMAALWYGKAAEQGLAVAEYRLASLYERGLGVAQDKQRAKSLYQRAAEKGNTRAMHNLGVLAVESPDGKPNYMSAALWFGKAAEYGVRDSQYNMAVLLARGLGLPKDLVKSYVWFSIVAAAGDPDAAKKRDEVGARLTSSEVASANAAAASFVPRQPDQAANQNPPPSAAPQVASPGKHNLPEKPKLSGL